MNQMFMDIGKDIKEIKIQIDNLNKGKDEVYKVLGNLEKVKASL